MASRLLLLIILLSMSTSYTMSQNFGWAANMGGTGGDQGSSIFIDSFGNVITVGAYSGVSDFDPGTGVFNMTALGASDIFISKLDHAGNFLWARSVGGVDSDNANSVSVDLSGNVYLTGNFWGTADFDPGPGTFNLTSSGSYDLFVLKLDASGNFVWAKSIGGSTEGDYGNALTLDPYGSLYVAGTFRGTVDFDPGTGVHNLNASLGNELFLIKLDTAANFVWARQTEGSMDINISSISIDASGNIYYSGNFQGSVDFDGGTGTLILTAAGADDLFVSKYNPSGDFIWAKSIGGTSFDYAWSIAADVSGNTYTTGSFQGTVDFDPGSGIVELTSFNSSEDAFILKLDTEGTFLWAKQIGGSSTDRPASIAMNPTGVYSTGFFTETADFDPGSGTVNLTSNGSLDIYILKLDTSGNYDWVLQIGGTLDDLGYGIDVDETEHIVSTGYFKNTVDFDPTSGIFNLISAGSNDVFVQKMTESLVSVKDNFKTNELSIFPNPGSGRFSISFSNPVSESISVSIYNASGLKVYELPDLEVTGADSKSIDIGAVESGIYTLIIKGNDVRICKKLIVNQNE